MSALYVKQLPLGSMENFTYVIGDKAAGEAFIIDPSGPQSEILPALKKENLVLKGILLTHGHYDHVVGIDKADVPVYLSQAEAFFYTPRAKQLLRTADDQKIMLGEFSITCLHTPGHAPGCQCFWVDGNLFTGDTLFVDAVGRTDLPGGNTRTLFESLKRIKRLPDATMIWPGHHYGEHPHETLGDMKTHNPFLQCESIEEFKRYLE